mmetsp:Transcript_8196/g.12337  ORF Transcript_8196/g.12337 Transcript_8196/m.12337 type:complete len:820 (+) Transcript_8196:102-2561(+)
MASLFLLLFFASVEKKTESFSNPPTYTFNPIHHYERRKPVSQALSSEEENNYSIKQVLNNVGNRVTRDKGAKEVNLELVSLGQQFDSFRRRFDYLSLLNKGNGPTKSEPSLWMRDNTQSVNLNFFMESSRGMSAEEANVHAQSLFTQSYHRITTSNDRKDSRQKNHLYSGSNIRYQVQTHKGKPAIVDDIEGTDTSEKIVSWEGDKYVTQLFFNGENATSLREERYLSSLNDTGSGGQNMMMIVNSTIFFHGAENEETKTVSCQEVFRPVYFMNEEKIVHEEKLTPTVFSSQVDRVPGCIANVNVRTTLVKKENDTFVPSRNQSFHVMVDGEADTLLSRGLLSVLASALSCLSSDDVLKIEPFKIADELNLRRVLSAGRNDGLSNMVSVVQSQIRQIIDGAQNFDNVLSENFDERETNFIDGPQKPTVAMLLSGGVDSAVALNLLCQQNYNVTAFYLKIWLEDELAHLGQCPWEDDYNTCIDVCEHAGNIPLEAISLQDAYKERVISYTIEEAKKGRTPNPDIMCNSRIKFGCFYDAIADRGFDYVASGHYAQLLQTLDDDTKLMKLLRAPDPVKDQSYFLAALRQDQLKRVLFPIGHLEKKEVRALAQELDLPNKSRPDSQGLCFLGKVKFDEFLSAYLGKEPGEIIDASNGEVIGRHNGIWYHTVGQRKGIGKVLDPKATSKGPWYVVAKDPSTRRIIASNKYDENIFEETRSEFYVEGIKWISGIIPLQLRLKKEMRLSMKIRHGPTIVAGNLRIDSSTTGSVTLEEKDGGLAPGQFVAFYDDLECLGSSVISEKHWMKFKSDTTSPNTGSIKFDS